MEVVESEPRPTPGGSAIVLADLPTAQRLLDREGEIDAVWLRVDGVRARFLDILDAVLPGITAAMPRYADPTIDDHRIVATRRWNPASRFADAMAFTLGALAMLSLLMAALVAAQASYSNMARRRLEQERLVAIGVSRQALRTLGVAEGLVSRRGRHGDRPNSLARSSPNGCWPLPSGATSRYRRGRGSWPRPSLAEWLPQPLGPSSRPEHRRAGHRTLHMVGGLGVAVAVFGIINATLLSAFAALAGLCAVQMAYTVPLFGSAASRLAALTRSIGARANLRAAAVRVGELRAVTRRAVGRRRYCDRDGAHG